MRAGRPSRGADDAEELRNAMKWSWQIGTVAGIGVFIHATFLILVAWVGLFHFLQDHSLIQTFHGIMFVAILFVIVVLHELGHALTARRFGIRTRDIILLPIGGVARLERMPEDPWQEFLVAIAGPAVNVALAGGLAAIILPILGPAELSLSLQDFGDKTILGQLFWVNILLAVFNMIPAFPMDGGRVLRALLASRLPYVQATQIAASIGQGMAFLLGFLGLLAFNPFMIFIALFVWMGAAEESSMVQMKTALGGIPVSGAMITEFETLHPDDELKTAVDHVIAGFQHDFPVVQNGEVVGILMRNQLFKALSSLGEEGRIADAMDEVFETADPAEMLDTAFVRLQSCECHTMPVVRDGRLMGLLTMENLGEFMMVQTALREARRPPHYPPYELTQTGDQQQDRR